MEKTFTLLVVEDDPSWRFNYEEILSDEGYKVIFARNKDEAFQQLMEAKFNAVMIDLRLVDSDPKNTDGVEVLKKTRDLFPTMPVIVNSGYLNNEVGTLLNQMRVSSILGKDGQTDKLIEILREIFGETKS